MKKIKVEIKGKRLECPFCRNDDFFELKSTALYPKKSISGLFFGKRPKVYICSNCGFKQEFLKVK